MPPTEQERGQGGRATHGRAADRADEDFRFVPLLAIANAVLRWRYTLLGVPALFAVVAFVLSVFFAPSKEWVASSRFLPEESGELTGAAFNLAGQLGIQGRSSSGVGDLYSEILTSREVLQEALEEPLRVVIEDGAEDFAGTVADYFRLVDPEVSPTTRLRNSVGVKKAPANLIGLETSAPDQAVALHLNHFLLQSLIDFNVERRQSQARSEREFVAARMAEAEQQLRAAEQELKEFLQANRDCCTSPQLSFERSRLERVVQLKQELYLSLARSHQQVRIQEVRDNPVLTVIESPAITSSTGGSLNVLFNVVLAMIVGLVVAVCIAFGREYLQREREEHPEEYARFSQLRRDSFSDFKNALKRIVRRSRERGSATAVANAQRAAPTVQEDARTTKDREPERV